MFDPKVHANTATEAIKHSGKVGRCRIKRYTTRPSEKPGKMLSTKNDRDSSQMKKQHQKRIIYGETAKPTPDCSLGEYLLEHLRKNGNHVVYLETETGKYVRSWDLMRDSVKLATILTARGIKVGDRITVMSENRLNWIIPACATIFAGGAFAPLNPGYTEWELTRMLELYKPRIIFASRRCEKLLVEVASKLPWQLEIIELDDEPVTEGLTTLAQLLQNGQNVDPELYTPARIKDPVKQPVTILASSGTTGLPKGVVLSHYNLLTFLEQIGDPHLMDFRRNDKLLLILPFYHGYAFGMLLAMIVYGTTCVLSRAFNGQDFLKHIQKYKITHLTLVPPIFIFLAKEPSVLQYDFSSIKQIICGAAPLPMELVDEVVRRVKCRTIRNAYGMTELTIASHINTILPDVYASVGPPMPGFLSKVIDPTTGEALGAGQVGEVCCKGKQVMLGYWENEDETAKTIDQEGWLHTGDLGYFDEHDQFFIVGRLKELIKYKGYQVSPVELETLLLSHPAVKDAAVVGKPDQLAGELPTAFVVKQPNRNPTADEIAKFVNQKVSSQKWLRGGVKFIEAIPKNPTGKILRKQLVTLTSKL